MLVDTIVSAPRDGTPVLLFSVDFIDEDFNPTGIIEGYWQDDYGWIGAIWNGCQDCWDRKDFLEPTHWINKHELKLKLILKGAFDTYDFTA